MRIEIANAERVVALAAAQALEPPPPIDYLTWAEDNIVFSARESPFPGPYDRRTFSYFDEVLRALSPDDPCRIITLLCSAQIGKTVIGNIFVGGSQAMDPGDLLVVHPTEDNARRWSRLKLKPMLRGTTALADLFPEKSRDGSDSILFKERADGLGSILVSGANSAASLSGVTMPRQVQDDLAKWELNTAGDPEQQADSRSGGIEFAKVLKTSTPLIMPGCRITKSFQAGSQEHPYVPCPHCDHFQILEWDNMLAQLDPEHPERAHFTCTDCGGVIEEHHRPAMVARLEWRAHNAKALRHHRSFWIWGAYSALKSWARIAQEWLKARGDSAAEQVFLNDTAGKAYEARGDAPPWEKLRDRASESPYARGTIPTGGLILSLGIDCQGDRVEWQLVAWGRDFRRWVVDYGVIPGHISDATCQERLDALLVQTWPNQAGRRVGIDRAAIDGNAYTEDVFRWARRWPISKLIMVRGRHEETAPRIARVKKERNERTGELLKWARRFFNFGASILKLALYRDLAKEDPQQKGYVGLPRGLDDEYFRQLTCEVRKPVRRFGFTTFIWSQPPGQPNEALDTMNQAETAANHYGLRGLPDAIWLRLEQERETPPPQAQGDLEDLLTGAGGANGVRTDPAVVKPVDPFAAKKRKRGARGGVQL